MLKVWVACSGCENLEFGDLSCYNSENITDISYIFCDCTNLKKLLYQILIML